MFKTNLFNAALFFCLVFASLAGPSQAQETPENASSEIDTTYLDELIHQAQELNLAEEHYWRLLMHYRGGWFGGTKSEVDGENFFLGKNGKHNPAAELVGTLQAFFRPFEPDPDPKSNKQHPRCQFVARYHWLKDKLAINENRLPSVECAMYDRWRKGIDAESVTLVFASYYLNNPASMFGHTLLRLNQKKRKERNNLLHYAVNYAATTGNDGGLVYTLKGLLGGYPGSFANYPYYFKVQEYSNINKRDIWEYNLDLSEEEVDRLMMHLWEIGSTYFHYYFFDENCSYHLLSLIEVARPTLRLQDKFTFFVAPSETVKVVHDQPGLVKDVVYRPSLMSRLRNKFSQLNSQERGMVAAITEDETPLDQIGLRNLSADRQALVLDTAMDYNSTFFERKVAIEKQKPLLLARSKLTAEPPTAVAKQFSTAPHLGHRSSNVSIGGGVSTNDTFEEARFRFAYHDLVNQDAGYLEHSEIEGLKVRMRFHNERKKLRLEKLTAIEVISLVPFSPLLKKISWNVASGVDTLRNTSCAECNVFFVHGGAGGAVKFWLGTDHLLYLLANAQFQAGGGMREKYRLGPKGVSGLVTKIGKYAKLHLSAAADYAPIGRKSYDYTFQGELGISLTPNIELRAEARSFRAQDEVMGTMSFYF